MRLALCHCMVSPDFDPDFDLDEDSRKFLDSQRIDWAKYASMVANTHVDAFVGLSGNAGFKKGYWYKVGKDISSECAEDHYEYGKRNHGN